MKKEGAIMESKTFLFWMALLLGGMFAFTLSFTLLGRVDNMLLASTFPYGV
ncbi:unnamed protein product [marine sediment metagenome]|uniref:Uncharacterized protein n=1 Tax=marine sediment metagenome TaxID=412755 RepID=X0Z3B4_9ZZZZ